LRAIQLQKQSNLPYERVIFLRKKSLIKSIRKKMRGLIHSHISLGSLINKNQKPNLKTGEKS
jgi:hypothetical protein